MAVFVPLGLTLLAKLTQGVGTTSHKNEPQSPNSKYWNRKNVKKPNLNIVGEPFYQSLPPAQLVFSNERIEKGTEEVEKMSENVTSYYEQEKMKEDKEIGKILDIVRNFIKDNQLVIYGGTAINALLPPEDQFYDYSKEIPDYDFYSTNARNDAKKLADILFTAGYNDAQARSGIHPGTYKVSANFTQVADITQLPLEYIEKIDVVKDDNDLLYAGPMWLRIDMYKQLSEIKGNRSRWPKVWKRLQLLNRSYPIGATECPAEYCGNGGEKCENYGLPIKTIVQKIIDFVKSQSLVLVGSLSREIYSKIDEINSHKLDLLLKNFGCLQDQLCLVDVLSENALEDAQKMARILEKSLKNVKVEIVENRKFDELFSARYSILINGHPIVEFIQPDLCFGFLKIGDIRYGTLDTIMTILMSKYTIDSDKYTAAQKGKYLCMLEFLMGLLEKYEFSGNEKVSEFPVECIGQQNDITEVFKDRWQERIDRLKLENQGIYAKPKNLLYRPYDVFLAKRGEISGKYIFE